jgi:hypothetical protein
MLGLMYSGTITSYLQVGQKVAFSILFILSPHLPQ